MSSSVITHGIMSIGNMLTSSIYDYVWVNRPSHIHQPPNYIPPPSTRTKDAEDDRIQALPGLDSSPAFSMFSGYLEVAPTREIFYWYIESKNEPDTDPVVLWSK